MFQIFAVLSTNDPWNVIVLHFLILNMIVSGLMVALVILLLPSLRLGIISSLTHTIPLIIINIIISIYTLHYPSLFFRPRKLKTHLLDGIS